jgi:carbon-monoxide dehydrogenase medium subunit
MRAFRIRGCASVADATVGGGDGAIYAGGTELLLVLKQGLARYEELVDVKGIPELRELAADGDTVRVGAAVTHRELELSPLIREKLPLLAEVERGVANVRVRNVGTIGGNLCFAEPHSDMGLTCILLDGTMVTNRRRIPAADFLAGAFETCLEPGELLVRVEFPVMSPRSAAGYQKFQFHERPTAAAGVVLTAGEDGTGCAAARVATGAAGPVPKRVPAAEALFVGRPWAEVLASARDAGRRAAAVCDPIADLTGSEEYKAHLVEVFVERATRQAVERLREGGHAR